jgi:hypothetical protein
MLKWTHYPRVGSGLAFILSLTAGVSDRAWEIADIVALLEQRPNAQMEQSKEQKVWKLSAKGPALGF